MRPSCNPGLPAWHYTVQRLPLRHRSEQHISEIELGRTFSRYRTRTQGGDKKRPYFSSSKVFESLRRTFELELSSNPLLPQIPALEWKQSQELCHVSFWEKARGPDVMWRDIRVFQKSLSFPVQLFFSPQAPLCVPKNIEDLAFLKVATLPRPHCDAAASFLKSPLGTLGEEGTFVCPPLPLHRLLSFPSSLICLFIVTPQIEEGEGKQCTFPRHTQAENRGGEIRGKTNARKLC